MDNIRHRLLENYEDALFALLMDDYALEEGARLYKENNDLAEDSAFTLPEGMDAHGLKVIRNAFRKKRLRSIAKTTGKVTSRVAILVLILNIVFGVSFFTVEAFRVEVLNMALSFQETHATVRFVGETNEPKFAGYTIENLRAVIPENYELISYEETPDGEYALFTNEDGARIMWDVHSIDVTANLDDEDADYAQKIPIDGHDGVIIEKDGLSTILWGDDVTRKIYSIMADMNRDELLSLVTEMTK